MLSTVGSLANQEKVVVSIKKLFTIRHGDVSGWFELMSGIREGGPTWIASHKIIEDIGNYSKLKIIMKSEGDELSLLKIGAYNPDDIWSIIETPLYVQNSSFGKWETREIDLRSNNFAGRQIGMGIKSSFYDCDYVFIDDIILEE